MRAKRKQNGLQLQAIAGTYVVLLGWDILDADLKDGLLGFAIRDFRYVPYIARDARLEPIAPLPSSSQA